MRLFAAIRPADDVLSHLNQALSMVSPPGMRHPWLPLSNWHITLAFYGEINDGRLPSLLMDFRETAQRTRPFSLELSGAGVFNHRVAWIGVADSDPLRKLAKQLVADAESHTGRPDPRKRNRAHLTVSRNPGLEDAMAALSVYRSPAWNVNEIVLYQSELGLGPGGHPLYTPLETATLD
jgi:2'-5' RNA ligase